MFAAKIVASTNNIPIAYDTTAGSLFFTAPSAGKIEIFHSCNAVLAIAIAGRDAGVTPPNSTITTNRRQLYIPPAPTGGYAGWVKDGLPVNQGDKVYIRSDSGSPVTVGTCYLNLW